MRLLALALLLLLLQATTSAQGEFRLRYRLEITDQGFATVTVQVDDPPRDDLEWSIGGASPDHGKDVRTLVASAADGPELAITALEHPEGGRDDQHWRVANRAGESFELRYQVTCSKRSHEGPGFEDGSHRPSLFEDWAVLFGHATFLIPRGADRPASTSLTIEVPEDWPLITDFGERLETADVSDLHWLLIAAGNLEHLEAKVGGAELHVAMRGPRRFTIDHVFGWIRKVIETQVALFGPHPVERFVVLVLPSRPGHYGGSVYRNTIELKFPEDETLEDPADVGLIAHEHFHLWNGHVIRPTTARSEGHFKWFSEGATVYYEKLTLFRAGLVDLEALVGSLNDSLRTYWNSPVRARATSELMESSYWTEPGLEEFGYQGGAMRALVLDALVRSESRGRCGLDDVMRRLVADGLGDGPDLDDARLAARLAEVGGASFDDFFRRHVTGVEPLPLDEACAFVGLAAPLGTRIDFELGFEVEGEFRLHVPVVSVVPESAAEAAGLCAGDRLAGFGFVWGNPDYEVSLEVDRGDERLQVRFFPRREREQPTLEVIDERRARAFFLGQPLAPR